MDELAIGDTRGNSITHYVTIGAVACTGIANGVVQGSLVGAAGELPERYMQALVGGTAASGVLVSLLRILTKAALPKSSDGLRQSSNLYFLVSAIFIVLCIVLQTFVHRLPVIQFYKTLDASISASTPLLQGERPTVSALERPPKHSQLYSVSLAEIKGSKMSWTPVRYWQTLKQIQGLVLSLTFIYVVTLSIFPGFITENVHSIKLGDWYPVLLITTYNVSDLLGKMLTAFYVVKDKATVEVMCIARILFFPLFASCLHGSAFMHTEAAVFISTLLLGVTNGYLSSVIMMSTPKMVAFQDAEVAGIIVVVFLLTGIAAGSILGWVWVI
ncbi:hypothetical protein O6H91_03G117400 [Diphasiastrum complanatum]|nr:hypothetical protein O6H91_03G117400 [Diphasiastrum complanatum]